MCGFKYSWWTFSQSIKFNKHIHKLIGIACSSYFNKTLSVVSLSHTKTKRNHVKAKGGLKNKAHQRRRHNTHTHTLDSPCIFMRNPFISHVNLLFNKFRTRLCKAQYFYVISFAFRFVNQFYFLYWSSFCRIVMNHILYFNALQYHWKNVSDW